MSTAAAAWLACYFASVWGQRAAMILGGAARQPPVTVWLDADGTSICFRADMLLGLTSVCNPVRPSGAVGGCTRDCSSTATCAGPETAPFNPCTPHSPFEHSHHSLIPTGGWRTSGTGACRASCGGATASPLTTCCWKVSEVNTGAASFHLRVLAWHGSRHCLDGPGGVAPCDGG